MTTQPGSGDVAASRDAPLTPTDKKIEILERGASDPRNTAKARAACARDAAKLRAARG